MEFLREGEADKIFLEKKTDKKYSGEKSRRKISFEKILRIRYILRKNSADTTFGGRKYCG